MADRRRNGPRPGQVLHHRPQHARQRAVELAEQHAAAATTRRASRTSRSRTRFSSSTSSSPQKFGIETLPLVTGWSMGAGQTYQWAVSFPDMVQRAVPFCGSSKTSEHNFVFLEGVKAALDRRRRLQGGLVRRAAGQGPARRRAGLRRLGLLAGVLLGPGLQADGLLARSRTSWWVLGGLLPRPPRPERPAVDVVDLAERRHRQHAGLRRRPRQGAALDQGEDDRAPGREGPVLPARGRAVRLSHMPNAECG